MLLRRITEHIKAQNWTAVGLDFLIVVVGVFIGIQVSNWNDARALQAQERSYLIVLLEDLERNIIRIEDASAYYTTVNDAAERALAFLESDADCIADCEGLLIDFFHASQVRAAAFDRSTLDEALRLGFPSNLVLRKEVEGTYELLEAFAFTNVSPPPFRGALRELLSPDAARILWADCWVINVQNQTEYLTRDCEPGLIAVNAVGMLRDIKDDPQLERMLRFWIGQNVLAFNTYQPAKIRLQKTIEALGDEI